MSAQGLPPGATADAANPQWTVPTDWQQGKSSSIRKASFAVNGAGGQSADIAVTAFPGEVGDLLSNINRWRGQIGLSPVTGEQVDQFTTRLDVNGAETTVVEITGDKPPTGKTHPQAMLVATLAHAGNSWFFKMTGDAPLVAEQKESFLQFVRSVKF